MPMKMMLPAAERLHHALDNDEFRLVTSQITSMDDDGFLNQRSRNPAAHRR